MKKLLFVLLALVFTASFAYAEISAQTYSPIPKFDEQVVFIHVYNPAATAITSNAVVILSMDANSPTYKATGSVVATTTNADSNYALGVTDGVIPAAGNGRVCVRGPHRVLANGVLTAGASMSTTTTAGYVAQVAGTVNQNSVVGVLLSATADPTINSSGVITDNSALYWIYVGLK